MKKKGKKVSSILALLLAFTMVANFAPAAVVKAAFTGALTKVDSAKVVSGKDNVVEISYNDGDVKGRITLLEDGIFRFNVDPSGTFSEYATPNSQSHTARIQAEPDTSTKYSKPKAAVTDANGKIEIKAEGGNTVIVLDKETAKMSIKIDDKTVMSEKEALSIGSDSTVQTLNTDEKEYFFGGGTQNGRFTHKGKAINIVCESGWNDGGVSSPNPFYWSSDGYGVLRNTFKPGKYDFGAAAADTVSTVHNESEFDAYYFVTNQTNVTKTAQALLDDYYKVTGYPVLLPEYGFYIGHLNAYNRDYWEENPNGNWTLEDGKRYKETQPADMVPAGALTESLNNEMPTVEAGNFKGTIDEKQKGDASSKTYKFSARAVIDGYVDNDMPLGWFLPNDGYVTGYGKNGYYVSTTTTPNNVLEEIVKANAENLGDFTDYAEKYGVRSGLWTQNALNIQDSKSMKYAHLLRDLEKEVSIGKISAFKTDVAWVGQGYSMALDAQQTVHDTMAENGKRPNVVSCDGWAGTQRFAGLWTGDQAGGNWEYIRFHIPSYIGQSLSGNPNVGSDIDGIYGGSDLIMTRDIQFKTFSTIMMDMDGWGNIPKKPHIGAEPYTSIRRMYLKLKAQLMPYLYTAAIDAAEGGLPMIRAMFLEEPNNAAVSDYLFSTATQYQYMYGDNFLVAPVYQDTAMEEDGDDIRNNIYLPKTSETWIDYFTGKQYRGGQVLNNFDAPLWKMPLFVKNGSIIPMYEENNNPMPVTETNEKGLDKSKRIIEFYPAGTTSYTLKEDDGITLESAETEKAEANYGGRMETEITSVVEGEKATLTAKASTGTPYTDYEAEKHTTFVVNVSEDPGKSNVTATNGTETVDLEDATSYEDFQKKAAEGKGVYFYDAAPDLNKYSQDDEDFADTKITTTPKLYVSFATTDVTKNEQKLVINGFKNVDKDLGADTKNSNLSAPTNLSAPDDSLTPQSITLNWDAVTGATEYELLIDGMINSVGNTTTFTHSDLDYHSEHTYQVRARNAAGYSDWSAELKATSLEDPWRNVLVPAETEWTGGIYSSDVLDKAFDHDLNSMFHSADNAVNVPLTLDFGAAYTLDKFEYYARSDNYGNGAVTKMKVELSMDGVHWKTAYDADETWSYNKDLGVEANIKEVDLTGEAARYVRLTALAANGNFFSAQELAIYKEDGSSPFAVGSLMKKMEVENADYTSLRNYRGFSTADTNNFNQIKDGDINMNGIYEVYDYAFTMFKLDGGTKKEGTVSGKVDIKASKASVAKDETFTVTISTSGVRNMNAIGAIIDYDKTKIEYVEDPGVKATGLGAMVDLSVNRVYDNIDEAYVNVAFANRGDQDLYSGSGDVITVTLKAKEAVDLTDEDVLSFRNVIAIGPNYSVIGEGEGGDAPTRIQYQQSDFKITMTNSVLTSDDGNNVLAIIQQQSYKGLFDGVYGRDFEFVYDYSNAGGAAPPESCTLPLTIHLTFNTPSQLNEVKLHNANKGNGYATGAEAIVNYVDGTKSDKKTIAAEQEVYDFTFAGSKRASSVDVTILSAINSSGAAVTNMLTLAELELWAAETGIDKAALQDRYDKYARRMAESGFEEHYTDESWKAYTDAIDAAKALLAKEDAPQTEVDQAYANLLAAHKALEPKVSADAFTDVKEAWMVENVANAYQQKLMTGKTSDTFAPVMPINRAEVAVVIHRMAGSPKEEKPATFTDLTQGWYKEAVNWASAAKKGDMPKAIVTGYSEAEFRPGNPISRQEIAMMLYRYAAYMGYDTSTEEDPNATVHWADLYDENDKPWGGDAETALRWCVAKGLITGNTKNGKATLDPFGTAYRVQAAAIFSRFADKFEN